MKPNKNNIIYYWIVFYLWAILIFVLCITVPAEIFWVWIVIPMFILWLIPLSLIIWYYKKDPDGQKAVKEAKEMQEYKRLVKECEKEDRKAYRRKCKEEMFKDNDDDFVPMDGMIS